MRPSFKEADLEGEYGHMYGALKYCHTIRNQFAHCNWADEFNGGLFFADLEESAKTAEGWVQHWHHVDVPLLEAQESFFVYTQSWFNYQLCAVAYDRKRKIPFLSKAANTRETPSIIQHPCICPRGYPKMRKPYT
jgi:hypothetical protein